MTTVTGNAYTLENGSESGATQITVLLCGYGSQNPRINGTGIFTGVQTEDLPIDHTTGAFMVELYGNDTIAPAGTYYVFTFANENGDVIQVNAYRFIDGQTYDLNLINPYDPNQPPPPFPPLITNLLQILPDANDMIFDGSTFASFKTTLNADVLMPTIQNMVPGNLYTFIIIQDGTGGHLFTWPGEVHNPVRIMPRVNGMTIQTFVADENEQLWAIGPGSWSQ